MRSQSPTISNRIASFLMASPNGVMKFIPHFRIFTSWARLGCQILAYITVLVAMVEMNIDILRHEIPDYLRKRSLLIGFGYPSSIYFVLSFIIMIQWTVMAIRTCFNLIKETPSVTVLTLFVMCKVIVIIICIADIVIIIVQYCHYKDGTILTLGLSWTCFKIVFCMVYVVALVTLHQDIVMHSKKTKEDINETMSQVLDSQAIYIPLHREQSPSYIFKDSYNSAISKIILNNIELTNDFNNTNV